MTYEEWESRQNFSGISPEASTAEASWNAAFEEARRVLKSTGTDAGNEDPLIDLLDQFIDLLDAEYSALNTGTGDSY